MQLSSLDVTTGNSEILIVLPAFNEADSVAQVVQSARSVFSTAEILVVDDGSTDSTARIAKGTGATVISHRFNLGYGAALQTGYKYAVRKGYDYLIQMDADGQHEPGCAPNLLRAVQVGGLDIAIGSRFLGESPFRAGVGRRLGMALFRAIVSVITGQKISDPTSGFQALGRKAFKYCATDIFPTDYPDADVVIALHQAGFRIGEVPVIMYANKNGKSMHQGLRPIYYLLKMMLSIFVTLLRGKGTGGQ